MLAALDWMRQNNSPFEFVAIGAASGRLSDALRERQIKVAPWSTFDDSGQRLPPELIERSLVEVVSRIQPDLLHANSLSMGRLTGRSSPKLRIPVVAHLRDIIKLSATAVMELNGNQQLIVVSKATRDFHLSQGVDASRMRVVYNGVNLDQFSPRPTTGRLRAELKLSSRDNSSLNPPARLIMNIGQIGLRKGQNVLVAAAGQIVERIPAAHFVFVGERNSNKQESIEFERRIQEDFKARGLADRLHLLGYRYDIAELLNDADVLVHTALQEPLGRVLLEGLATGIPMVATDVGGTREIIDDQATGLLIPPNEPTALADAVTRVLADAELSKRLRSAARIKSESQFSIELSAKSLANVWSDTLQNAPGPS